MIGIEGFPYVYTFYHWQISFSTLFPLISQLYETNYLKITHLTFTKAEGRFTVMIHMFNIK
jgi:hypothetical protein